MKIKFIGGLKTVMSNRDSMHNYFGWPTSVRLKNGKIAVPDAPGLGVELDWEQVQKAHEAYKRLPGGARNDAGPMQYLIPGWTFDRKRPVFGRH